MRVLHLIDHLGPGGSQTQLADYLEARGRIQARVVALSPRALSSLVTRIEAAGAAPEVVAVGPRAPGGLAKLRRRIRGAGADILHTRLDVSNTVGVAVALSLGRRRPRIVRSFDNDPVQHYRPAIRLMTGRLAPFVDAEIAVSRSVASSVERTCAGRVRRMEVVPPGLELERFDASRTDPARKAQLRAGATHVIGTVARLTEQKNPELLLDALAAVRAALPGVRLVVAGDGPLRPALEQRAEELGIADRVAFLGHAEDVVSVYAALDVFVLPSRHEGFGVAFLEAMAMGVPVVGTRVVGSVDAVRDGDTGLLVPSGDRDALADAILRLLTDEGLARRLVAHAGRWVREQGSREAMAAAIERLYEDLCPAPR